MNGLAVLMLIFGVLIVLCGLWLYTGHNGDFTRLLLWKSHKENFSKEELRFIGKWTILSSLNPFIIAVVSIIFDIN